MPGFLAASERAFRAAPTVPRAVYNLGCAYARNDRPADALAQLDRLVAFGVFLDARADDDFAKLRGTPAFEAALKRLEAVRTRTSGNGGERVARFPAKDLIAEGIARDPKTGALFVSSVRKRKILKIAADGVISDWAAAGLDGVFGIDVDPASRTLYACTSSVPQMEDFIASDQHHAALVAFDLDTAAKKHVYPLSAPTAASPADHLCNDLAVDLDGSVVVSDTGTNTLLILLKGASGLAPLATESLFASPQGIAVAADALYVADYARGIARLDRANGSVRFLAGPEDVALSGIDCLRAVPGGLVAIQNGVEPHRIVALSIHEERVVKATVLAMNDARWREPTLGIVVGRELFYNAASQWGAFDRKGALRPTEVLVEPLVMRLPLP